MRVRVAVCSFALIVGSAATGSAASPAPGPQPVRSGTITGWGATWVAMFNGEARDCEWSEWQGPGNPECLVWLKSGCDPKLAGRPGRRTFSWDAISYPGWGIGGGVVVQLWRSDCTEIRNSKWRSAVAHSTGSWSNRKSTTFAIPAAAKWMTVTTNDTAKLEWTLR